jgi:hypothetical protein
MGHKKCVKCEKKKNLTKHHIFGKSGYHDLIYDSKLPLLILLAWLERKYDEVTILFWKPGSMLLCRKCHNEFHILLSRLVKECDITQSGEPIRKYLEEKNVERMGSRLEYTY